MKKKVIILACVLAAVLGVSAFVIFRIPAKPKYTKGNTEISERIENIRIECGSGRFTVISSDKNKIEVKETGNTDKSDSTLNWAVTGKTLRILCNSKKDSEYLLTIPGSYVVDDLDIAAGVEDLRRTDADLLDRAAETAVNDDVAHVEDSFKHDEETREDIRDQGLCTQAYD